VEAFLIGALTKRDENRRFDQIRRREYLAPSRMSGEARRVRTAPGCSEKSLLLRHHLKRGPAVPFFVVELAIPRGGFQSIK